MENIFNFDNFLILWTGIMAVGASLFKKLATTTVKVLGKDEKRYKLGFAVLVFLPVFCFAAFGPMRADVHGYVEGFLEKNDSFADIFCSWTYETNGKGFELIEAAIKSIFGNNATAFRVIIALLQSIPLVLVYRKYSCSYITSIFLFIASTCYNAWMMNGLRQFVAATLIFLCLPLIVKKKYFLTIIVILLAATIHQTAVVMLPVIFIVQMKPWKRLTSFTILLLAVAVYFYAEYSGVISEELLENDDGVNPIRVLVYTVPVALAFFGRKQLKDEPFVNICINMSVITFAIYFVAMLTSGIMTGRLPIYMGLYDYILLPYLIKEIFSERDAKIVSTVMITCYIFYFAYSLYL